MNKQLKIKKEFWNLILSGEKQYEFRKLSKVLPSGIYEFVDSDTKEILGTASLNIKTVDKKTFNWVKKNYIDKNIKFVGYEISNVNKIKKKVGK